jgi:dimethylhistidine N-methyltransferase
MLSSSVQPLIDAAPASDSLRSDVLSGLQREQKEVPSKYLYDARGSQLFDAICNLDEYYPTRTEMSILQECVGEMADALGPHVQLVEYGSGSSLKTRILLDHLDALSSYVPVDISREHLLDAAGSIAEAYPDLAVQPVCADYTAEVPLPDLPPDASRRVVYYPGSTIGNFQPSTAQTFLSRIADCVGTNGGLLIGVDLRKSPDTLRAAYNDAEGVTAAFNKNLLHRLNRELDADFDVDAFHHEAQWNADAGCIEMHLVSDASQTVHIGDHRFAFSEGESIRTEYSYKYTLDGFSRLASRAGFSVDQVWTDDAGLFSIQYATAV